MAFTFTYPTPLPNTKGWGPGWPDCQSGKMVTHPVFKPSLHEDIHELVTILVYEIESRGFRFLDPGCWGYACRGTKAQDGSLSDTPSFHSWGLAIDINAPKNPFGQPESSSQIATDERWVVPFLRSYGFFWLGPAIKDWMHFSFCGSREDARRMTIKARKELGDVKYDEFEDGIRAYWHGDPEPTQDGPKRFGWNVARRAETRPAADDPTTHSHPLEDHKHTPGGVV